MQFIHRISVNSAPEIQRELAAMGIFIGEGNPITSNLVAFEIPVAHRRTLSRDG
jgi:hypothetical protein